MRQPRLFASMLCTFAVACAAVAQAPAPVTASAPASPAGAKKPAEPSFGPLPAFALPPGSKVDMRGLMWRMNHYMAGERVMSTGYGEFRDDIPWSDEDFKKERTLIGRLQLISAKQSPPDHDLIPFKVGLAYVIAPDTREQPNLDLSGASEFDLSSRGLLIDQVLTAIPAGQIAALGSENGIAVSSLSRDLQSALARAFRTPLKIMNMKPSSYTSDDGLEHAASEVEEKGRIDDPIDWTRARIRARLRISTAFVDMKPYGASISQPETGQMFGTVTDLQRNWRDRGVDLPLFEEVPNTYKPSDLAGKTFTQPLNFAGAWTVEEVAKQIAKITGLKLYVSQPYRDEPVFIGSNSLTAGEAIDGLRLALTASWRKLGSAYVLAWDRVGVQAVQILARESAAEAAKAVKKRRRDTDASTDWIKIAEHLPFETSTGLYLTEDQRSKVFASAPEGAKAYLNPDTRRVNYTEMTPDQQAWIRAAAAKDSVDLPGVDGQPSQRRPFTDQDIQGSYLQGDARIDFSVNVPGYGWVRAGNDWDNTSVTPWNIARAREKLTKGADGAKRDVLDGTPKEIRDLIENPQPATPPSAIRALMVPPLGAARLKVLADEMKRHGLNTLFYPVLYGGYCTFESKVFPLHPSLRGADGWAAATAAMNPAGIKVIGYLQTLAWQESGDHTHYLSKHPEWLDVDVVGRSRGAWFEAHPAAKAKALTLGFSPSNFVRPAEQMVSYRLQIMVDEFARKTNAAGICFTDWNPVSMGQNSPFSSVDTPALGFGIAERITALQKVGTDPVDMITSWDDFVPPSLASKRWATIQQNQDTAKVDPHRLLIADLLKRAKAARKDWKTWLVDDQLMGYQQGNANDDYKKDADETIGGVFGSIMRNAGKQGVILPVTSQNLIAAMADEEMMSDQTVPESVIKMPAIVTYSLFFSETMSSARGNTAAPQFSCVVYDFRTAPDEISPSLRWIKAPEKGSSTPPKSAAPVAQPQGQKVTK